MTHRATCAATVIGLACILAVHGMAGEAYEHSNRLRADAQLADVCFVDAAAGWAVGDRGAIWHTPDGGQHWTLQDSGVDCRLNSVFFLDAQVGWAAGGQAQPYTHTSNGVVLTTHDGGQTWSLKRKVMLPSIERIGFVDANRGWALGRCSARFPSGVFTTQDGGRSWSAVPATESRAWLTGDFIDPNTGALAGALGTTAAVHRHGVEAASSSFGLRALHALKLRAPSQGWLVGDGGLVLKSQDLGKTWQTTGGEIPSAIANHFDFIALAVLGRNVWVAGSPGTCVLHSGDDGRTWNLGDTGQTLPIRALAFVNDLDGYAVGELGTILTTRDGGRTWNKQRGGGSRAAYVGFYSRAEEIPLELVAQLSADEGYLAAVELVNRDDVEVRNTGNRAALAHEACVLAGASSTSSTWRFPLRQPGLSLTPEQLVEVWNRANDGKSLERLEAHVVSRIRMWQPSVVFTAAADARNGDPAQHIVNQVVLRACEYAADAARYPEQLGEVGLRPWSVQKVYSTLPPGQAGSTNINTAQLAARLGCSIGELAAPARGLIVDDYSPPPGVIGFRLLVDHIPQQAGQRDFFSGISLSPGGEARRALDDLVSGNMEVLRREVQLRRNLQAILARSEAGERDGRFVADFAEQTRMMQPSRAAEVLFQLGERYHHQGRWELAAECFDLVVERYPTNALAGKSLMWLVQYYASGEAAWRNRATQQHTIEQVSARAPAARERRASAALNNKRLTAAAGTIGVAPQREPQISATAGVERAAGLVLGANDASERVAKAAGYAKQMEDLQPALFGEPEVRFPLAVAQRRQGLPRQAERFYQSMRSTRPQDAWRDCAVTELWLSDPKNQPPKEIYACQRTENKPHLDGRLDEPFWRSAAKAELHSPQRDDGDWGAVALLAYDDEFLYIGLSCTQAEGSQYVQSDEARPRDAEMTQQDRVDLLIDIDHDFATYYQLSIDSRGWTAESCWHDTSWNPTWFVAAGQADGAWTAEAAIALSELSDQQATPKKSWVLGIQRIVPGVGFQSWTSPAATNILPEGFGYLMFQ